MEKVGGVLSKLAWGRCSTSQSNVLQRTRNLSRKAPRSANRLAMVAVIRITRYEISNSGFGSRKRAAALITT